MTPLPLSARAMRTTGSPISYFIRKAIETPGLISLAAGLVDAGSLPASEIAEAVAEILGDGSTARAALQYGSTAGYTPLREQILSEVCTADGVRPSDIGLSIEDVVLSTGSQQLLYLLGEVLLDEGDIVITEAPSYFVYHGALASLGARVLSVPMDSGGMNLSALEELLESLKQSSELNRVKIVYTVDYFQNPTGLTLAADRRPRLVELVRRFSTHQRIVILEDAAYRELRYEGPDLPSVKRFDEQNEFVVYTSTFSKPCAPGLKTGYALLPRDLVAPICHLKGNHDFGSSNFAQHILHRLLESGAYRNHVTALRDVYRTKRDAMLRAITEEFADWPEVRWTQPGGGLYVWMTFPSHIVTGAGGPLVDRALDAGVLYVPGEYGHVPDEFGHVPNTEARLSFGVASPEEITEAIRRLRQACRGLERVPVPAMAG